MDAVKRWQSAQLAEGEYWNRLTALDEGIRGVLEENREVAARIAAWLPAIPDALLEIGVGGLGVGTLGFLQESPLRIGVDPLPPPPLTCGDSLRSTITALRRSVHLVTAQGERTPFPDASFDLVICSNVLDHVRDPQAVIAEAHRILRLGGHLYLEVDVFSLAGLAKWHLWTRHRRRKEILVRAHPYRFREMELLLYLKHAGLQLRKINEVPFMTRLLGRSWVCTILAQKSPA